MPPAPSPPPLSPRASPASGGSTRSPEARPGPSAPPRQPCPHPSPASILPLSPSSSPSPRHGGTTRPRRGAPWELQSHRPPGAQHPRARGTTNPSSPRGARGGLSRRAGAIGWTGPRRPSDWILAGSAPPGGRGGEGAAWRARCRTWPCVIWRSRGASRSCGRCCSATGPRPRGPTRSAGCGHGRPGGGSCRSLSAHRFPPAGSPHRAALGLLGGTHGRRGPPSRAWRACER